MTAQQVRNSILQEAIEGRLVPQDPSEEPASVLLEKIREEKKRLVKEGKLKKKDLEENPITEEEKPFEIPESWEWVRIESITIPIGNKTNQIQTKDILPEGNIPVVSQGQKLIDGYSNEIERAISDLPLVMFGDHTRNVKLIDFPFVIGADGTKFFKPILCDAKYVYYLIMYVASRLRNRGYARHYTLLKEEPLPLPPLDEQKRIVANIEELMPMVEEYGKAQEKLNRLNEELPERMKKSVLQEAIQGRLVEQDESEEAASVLLEKIREEKKRLVKEGKLKKKDLEEKPITEEEKPFEIPESWEWVRVFDCVDILYGYPFDSTLFNELGQGFPLIRIRDILPAQTNTYTTEKADDRYIINKGDMIVGMDGNFNVRFWSSSPAYLNQRVCRIKTKEDILVQKFLYYYLPIALEDIFKTVSFVTVKHLSDKHLREMYIPLPPLAEQRRIVEKIEKLFAEIDKLTK